MKIRSLSCAVILGTVCSIGTSSPVMGQIPSQARSSPINYFGRFHGFGYSDGYHSCPTPRSPRGHGLAQSLGSPADFSSYYGSPTAPTAMQAPPYMPLQQTPAIPSMPAYSSPSLLTPTPAPPRSMMQESPRSSTPSMTTPSPTLRAPESTPSPSDLSPGRKSNGDSKSTEELPGPRADGPQTIFLQPQQPIRESFGAGWRQ
jgi:hypothetical protein